MTLRVKIALVAAGALLAAIAHAQPSKPIRFLVGSSPGGATDIVARLIAQKLTEGTGQQVVVDNRTGASGNIATELLVRAAPDGHTILACTNSMFAIQPFLGKKLPYDPEKDLATVTQTVSQPYILAIHPSLPARSVKELVAIAQRRPGEIHYGSAGIGTSSHLAAALFESRTGARFNHVPYKGTGQALTDLLAGQVGMLFVQTVSSAPHIQAGKLRALGISSPARFPALPEIPTIAEAGIPDYDAVSWTGVCAPAATAPPIVARLNGEIVKVLRLPDVRSRLLRDGVEPVGSTPEEFRAHARREAAKWSRLIREIGVTTEG